MPEKDPTTPEGSLIAAGGSSMLSCLTWNYRSTRIAPILVETRKTLTGNLASGAESSGSK